MLNQDSDDVVFELLLLGHGQTVLRQVLLGSLQGLGLTRKGLRVESRVQWKLKHLLELAIFFGKLSLDISEKWRQLVDIGFCHYLARSCHLPRLPDALTPVLRLVTGWPRYSCVPFHLFLERVG